MLSVLRHGRRLIDDLLVDSLSDSGNDGLEEVDVAMPALPS